MAQQRFEAWPPLHLKAGTLGGDLARHLNAGLNGVVQNAVLEVDAHKKRSETLDRVETVPLHWTLDDNGVRFPGWTLDDNAAATSSGGGESAWYASDDDQFVGNGVSSNAHGCSLVREGGPTAIKLPCYL